MKSQIIGLIASAAVVVSGAVLAISGSAAVGRAATLDAVRLGVAAVVIIVALVLGRPTTAWRQGAYLGIGAAIVLLFLPDISSGSVNIGAGQVGALVGAVAAVPLLGIIWSEHSLSWIPTVLTLAVLVFVGIGLIRAVVDGGALGHDESAYVLKTRAWLFDSPDTGWQIHRAPLISVIAVPIVAFTESEIALRMIGVATGVIALVAVGLVGHRLGGRWAGLLAAGVVGASLAFLRRGSELLTDVPAAGILLVITWVALRAVTDPESYKRQVLWLGPLVAAAFYMRYQSVLAVLGIAAGVAIAFPRELAELRRPVTMASVVALLAVMPHMIWATAVTGRPWGVVLDTSDAAGREFLGQGLVDYVGQFFLHLAGPGGAIMLVIAFGWLIWSVTKAGEKRRLGIFFGVVVIVSVVPLGLVAHGEPRFIFYPVWLLIAIGSAALVQVTKAMDTRSRLVLTALAVVLWLPLFTETLRRVDRNAEARAESLTVLVEASNQIETDGDGSCGVLTTYQPQVTWYSGCFTEFMASDESDLGVGMLVGERLYVLLFENGKRQPRDAGAKYIELGPSRTIPAANDVIGDATVVSLTSS